MQVNCKSHRIVSTNIKFVVSMETTFFHNGILVGKICICLSKHVIVYLNVFLIDMFPRVVLDNYKNIYYQFLVATRKNNENSEKFVKWAKFSVVVVLKKISFHCMSKISLVPNPKFEKKCF